MHKRGDHVIKKLRLILYKLDCLAKLKMKNILTFSLISLCKKGFCATSTDKAKELKQI